MSITKMYYLIININVYVKVRFRDIVENSQGLKNVDRFSLVYI